MSDVTVQRRRGVLRPLDADEGARAARVADRLGAELGRVVGALPEHAQGASGMSRHLSVVRTTCQRIVTALGQPADGALMLMQLPGVEGLRQFLAGVGRVGGDEADIGAAEAAVDAFDRLIRELAGSQSRLGERLRAGGPESVGATYGDEGARRALFDAAFAVTGRACEMNLSIYAFRRCPEDAGSLERAMASGMIGSVVSRFGMPMVLSSGETLVAEDEAGEFRSLDRSPARGSTPSALLAPFTTDPLPRVTSRGTSKSNLLQIIDPEALDEGQLVDVVSANRSRHALTDSEGQHTLNDVWTLINCPARHKVFDVYLHRDMERLYRPSVDVQMWNPNLSSPGGDRWVTRFPVQVTLQLLGQGLGGAACAAYPRHDELTRFLFDQIGWPGDEFIGFRCEMSYPIWRSGLCMHFEHVAGDAGGA